MERNARYQKFETPDMYMGGPDTAFGPLLDSKDAFMGDAYESLSEKLQGISRAKQNCWTGAQGLVQYIGGFDLGEIDQRLPYFYRAPQMQNWLKEQRKPETGIKARLSQLFSLLNGSEENDPYVPKVKSKTADSTPYFITRRTFWIGEFLEQEIDTGPQGKITIAEYLDQIEKQGRLAKAKPVKDHLHMQEDRQSIAEHLFS